MLQYIELNNVGPAAELSLELAPRLNLLTGDNGLGKSFLLDIAWWALTRKWPAEINHKLPTGLMAKPYGEKPASIKFSFSSKKGTEEYQSKFDRKSQAWSGRPGRPANPGLVLYAQVDGSFALWDPARNYWRKKGGIDIQDRPPAYVFSPREIWNGLDDGEGNKLCNGLIVDWAGWQKEGGETFNKLTAVLKALSPSEEEFIKPGPLTRISLDDVRDIPTLKMPYGQEVPVLHVSAGIRRIISMAYLLVWAWEEHLKACDLLGEETTNQVVFLVDEIEAHLHPKWQKRIIRALLEVMDKIMASGKTQQFFPDWGSVQLITATHSPLIFTSVEPYFDPEKDVWFDLDLVLEDDPKVVLTKRPFIRKGDANSWLTSEAFDLESSRSIEAEKVIEKASDALTSKTFDAVEAKNIDKELRKILGETDPFWLRWRYIAEKKGWIQ